MTSPWLRDYVLQELGSEIRKQGGLLLLSQHEQEQKKAAGQKQNPGGQQQQQQQQQQQKSSTTRLVKIIARSSNFNKINNSNNNNNININHGCWLLVSDGSCSVKIHFTVQALQQIYDCDNNNENSNSNSNNNDCFFGRGCCILLQKYSVEYDLFHVATATNNNSNDNNNNNDGGGGGGVIVDLVNVIANLNNIDMERYPVRLKVSSLEAKPSFNNHITISANNSNNNNNNNNNTTATRIRPVLEDIDVLYAVQYLKRQQHIQIQQGNNNNHNNNVSCGSRKSLARDWDIAFGRLSKGSFAANDGDDDDDDDDTTSDKTATTATIGSSRNLQQIIDLADKACSTDEAIRAWDIAKNEYGINGNNNNNDNDDDDDDDDDNTGDGGIFNINVNGAMAMTTNNNKMTTNIPDRQDINKDGGHDDDDADDDEEEDHSRMYIQNVLATQEGVDENNDEDEDEELLLLETQPQPTTNTDIATAACTTPSTPPSRNAKYILDTAQSSIVETVTIMKPSIDNEKRNTNIDENIFDENEIIMQTQPTRNDGIDDATPSTPRSYIGAKQYQQKHQSLYQEKQPMQQRQDEEESSKNNTSIWESIKEQCFDESRPFLHFVPSWRIVSSGGNNNNNDIPITPNKKMISTTSSNYNNTDIGSVGSIGTNFTLSSPNPSSGAYYKKYGLARWLKKNTVVDDNNNNNSNDDDGFVNDTTTTTTTTHAETK
jgi:hypothetical protein